MAPAHVGGLAGTAMLVIDMINSFDFPRAEKLTPKARAAVGPVLALRAAVEAAGMPVICVNDNFGEWHSEKAKLFDRAATHETEIVDRLRPTQSQQALRIDQERGVVDYQAGIGDAHPHRESTAAHRRQAALMAYRFGYSTSCLTERA